MTRLNYQYAVAQTAYPGNPLNLAGDRYVIEPFNEGVLVGVIDGLGHGSKAAEAAVAAAEALSEHPSRSTPWLLEHCNQSIRSTRGAAVSVVAINTSESQLEWAGVGNVTAMIVRSSQENRKHESLLTKGGVIGFRMPSIRPACLDIGPYDMLILATDGIRGGFLEAAPLDDSPQALADHILEHHKRQTDDALVVVLRFVPEHIPIR